MIQVFELVPEYSGTREEILTIGSPGEYTESINLGTQDIGTPPQTYTFVIRTRDKPDRNEKERIKRLISQAWEDLFNVSGSDWANYFNAEVYPPPLGISVIGPNSGTSSGNIEIPEFSLGGFYIVFVHMESAGEVPDKDYQEIQEDLRQGFESSFGSLKIKPRIALIPLYNCTVELIIGKGERRHAPKRNPVHERLRRHGLR